MPSFRHLLLVWLSWGCCATAQYSSRNSSTECGYSSAACTAKLVLEVSQRANTTNATQLTTGITQAVDSFLPQHEAIRVAGELPALANRGLLQHSYFNMEQDVVCG
ncbi:hypothetical protein HaLaN_31481 [Haematococcus lacustris]|uniref:Uncharacterized protein n=1 Tax=Haematococcus lacustris TaxID=44745 RepID=A0A6A0AID6_HAELA|nr:hypothetical protein HaLaN_31481 [Haematococcus lacustris]